MTWAIALGAWIAGLVLGGIVAWAAARSAAQRRLTSEVARLEQGHRTEVDAERERTRAAQQTAAELERNVEESAARFAQVRAEAQARAKDAERLAAQQQDEAGLVHALREERESIKGEAQRAAHEAKEARARANEAMAVLAQAKKQVASLETRARELAEDAKRAQSQLSQQRTAAEQQREGFAHQHSQLEQRLKDAETAAAARIEALEAELAQAKAQSEASAKASVTPRQSPASAFDRVSDSSRRSVRTPHRAPAAPEVSWGPAKPVPTEPDAAESSTDTALRGPVKSGAGPCVLDALATDPNLSAGQRETVRAAYQRMAPSAQAAASLPADTTVLQVLDADPYLRRGQREAIRTIYESIARTKRK